MHFQTEFYGNGPSSDETSYYKEYYYLRNYCY